MLIIEKKDLEIYRFIVAKVVFLEQYHNKYQLIKDIKASNCMEMIRMDTNQKVVISLLSKPKKNKDTPKLPIIVFYQKRSFRDSSDKRNNSISYVLTSAFDSEYDKCIGLALIEPLNFINKYKNKQIDMMDILGNAIIAKPIEKQLFKYYSTLIENNQYGQLNGKISFMPPQAFNDPFDCNCLSQNGNSLSNCFRVFCCTEDRVNIPMWAYYGENHKGYCFEYSQADILKELMKSNPNALCIIGEVTYSKKRPDYFMPNNSLSYTNIKKYIDCTFTKYDGWKQEKEYRFVLISQTFNSNSSVFQVTVPIKNIFTGCNHSGKSVTVNNKTLTTHKLIKDLKNYSLK